ncbi:uncharacterized protein LOC144562006 isoform X1 [Carex rostrata]
MEIFFFSKPLDVCALYMTTANVGKLDPRAVRCIFVGYSATQKGYVYWSPVERRRFVNMDVTFYELEPYYSSEATSPFEDSLDTGGMRQEGENSSDGERRTVTMSVGGSSRLLELDFARVEPEVEWIEPEGGRTQARGKPKVERIEPEGGRTQAQGESRYGEVYVRRKKQNEGAMPIVPHVPSLLSLPTLTLETPTPSTSNEEYTGDMISLPTPPTPLSVRMTPR